VAGGFIAQDGVWQSLNGPIARYRIMVDKLSTGATIAPVKPLHPVQPLREGVQPLHPTGATTAQTGATTAPNPSLTVSGSINIREREPAGAGAPSSGTSPSGELNSSDHPAVRLAAMTGVPMSAYAIKQIIQKCTDLKRLEGVVNYCLTANVKTVATLLLVYEEWPNHRANPEAKRAQSNGRRAQGKTFRREQCPPRNGVQSEIDACRRNAKNARDRGDVVKAEKWEAAAINLEAKLAQL
jgi:hypothetical protein